MGFWNRAADTIARADSIRSAVNMATVAPQIVPSSYAEFQAMRSLWAMQIPSYRRGVNLITGVLASMPIRNDGDLPPNLTKLAAQPERACSRWVTMNRLSRDLVNRGRAYWLIETPVTGYRVKRLPADDTTQNSDGSILCSDGVTRYPSDPEGPPIAGRVVVFTGTAEGALDAGSEVLTTAAALQSASRKYAETPHPGDVLENTGNYDMNKEEIQELIDDWVKARRESSTAYLNPAVKLGDPKGWSPTELALDTQRNQSALDVARLLNLDALWLSVTVGGSALTYTSRVDLRQDLYGLTLTGYIDPIEQRLSMRDVFGVPTRLDPAAFLRANLGERVTMAIDLLAAGIIDKTEARAFVSDVTTGGPV